MRNETVATRGGRRIVLMDSISLIGPDDEGAIIVCGSHGGAILRRVPARHGPSLVLFNGRPTGWRAARAAPAARRSTFLARAGIACATLS